MPNKSTDHKEGRAGIGEFLDSGEYGKVERVTK